MIRQSIKFQINPMKDVRGVVRMDGWSDGWTDTHSQMRVISIVPLRLRRYAYSITVCLPKFSFLSQKLKKNAKRTKGHNSVKNKKTKKSHAHLQIMMKHSAKSQVSSIKDMAGVVGTSMS